MTFMPEHKPKPGDKRVEVGEFETFKFPDIRGREPSAVDLLAAVVDEKARERVERTRRGVWPRLAAADIAGVQPMTEPHRRRHQ